MSERDASDPFVLPIVQQDATVLLVDDDPNILDSLRRSLHGEAYTVLSATSASEALATLKRTAVDVIVSDERMPRMGGAELMGIVRKRHPGTMRVILSGYSRPADMLRAINEGEVFRYMHKPALSWDVRATINAALKRKTTMARVEELEDLDSSLDAMRLGTVAPA